jgi:hypothetical protein
MNDESVAGYDHVTPSTNAGRLFTVFFGLLGIPLMFITAADIGKFLSEMVTRSYSKLLQFCKWMREQCAACRDKLRRTPKDDESLEEGKGRANGDVQKDLGSLGDEDLLGEEQRVELPILSYFGLILGYCAVGSMLFTSFEKGPVWTFIHGYVSGNSRY